MGLNRGKNATSLKAYQPFFATPDSQLDSFPLFSQASQFPPLNPDNKESSCEKIFLGKAKNRYFSLMKTVRAFASYKPDITRQFILGFPI